MKRVRFRKEQKHKKEVQEHSSKQALFPSILCFENCRSTQDIRFQFPSEKKAKTGDKVYNPFPIISFRLLEIAEGSNSRMKFFFKAIQTRQGRLLIFELRFLGRLGGGGSRNGNTPPLL